MAFFNHSICLTDDCLSGNAKNRRHRLRLDFQKRPYVNDLVRDAADPTRTPGIFNRIIENGQS